MVSRSVSFTLMHDWPSEVFGALDVLVVVPRPRHTTGTQQQHLHAAAYVLDGIEAAAVALLAAEAVLAAAAGATFWCQREPLAELCQIPFSACTFT